MYTGQLFLKNQQVDRMFDLMSIGKTLELTNMTRDIAELLKEGLDLKNVFDIYEKAVQYDQIKLKISCEYFIDHNAEYLVDQKSMSKLSSQCLQEILGRDSFLINESKLFELVSDWHAYHNRTENLDNELIKKIRFELFSNEELLNLTHYSKLVDSKLVCQILKDRILHKNTKTPTRQFQTKLVSGSDDNTIKIWNVDTGECVRTLTGHSHRVHSLQLLANEWQVLASGSFDSTIKIWNLDTGECIRTLKGHSSFIMSLQLLPNNTLASGSYDTTIKIWNVDSGKCIRTLTGHSNWVR